MKAAFRDIRPERLSAYRHGNFSDAIEHCRAAPMKMLLVATTALVCVTSLATASALAERHANPSYGELDANDEFLCNYGFKLRATVSYSTVYYYVNWVRAATPVIGEGRSVNEIIVNDGGSGGADPSGIKVAIYSSHGNRPKKKLAFASAAPSGCGRVRVLISPVTLEKGKRYWIVQRALTRRASSSSSNPNSILWLYDKTRTHGALSQAGYSVCFNSCFYRNEGPWKPITTGVPYARVGESVRGQNRNVVHSRRAPATTPFLR